MKRSLSLTPDAAVSPIVACVLMVGITMTMFIVALQSLGACIVVCDSHACDSDTVGADGRQEVGCLVYRSDASGTHAYRVEESQPGQPCPIFIMHGLRCLVRI